MKFMDTILSWSGFGIVCLVALVSPWLFGAWEMWYFWPFVAAISLSTALFGFRMILLGRPPNGSPPFPYHDDDKRPLVRRNRLLAVCTAFLIYAAFRMFETDVYMDAERSFLLFFTAFILGLQVAFGFSPKQRQLAFCFLAVNILLLGLYGIINHIIWDNECVMWLPGEEHYQNNYARATGSYFCPDHFAGILELGLCLCIGLWLDHRSSKRWKLFAIILSLIAITGILLSASRGAGITVAALVATVMIWGVKQLPAKRRMQVRLAATGVMIVGVVVMLVAGSSYSRRFASFFTVDAGEGKSTKEITSLVGKKLLSSTRGRMYSGAYRAWQSKPVFGIGPGMHQHLWPHFAASPDGDRELGVWPTQPNDNFRSFEVHSDWLQLLEEYGLVGFLLVLAVFCYVLYILRVTMNEDAAHLDVDYGSISPHALMSTAFFALLAMGFHSLGDFNLQMPATTWVLSVIVSLGLHSAVTPPHPDHDI